jgi:hypothetical protein
MKLNLISIVIIAVAAGVVLGVTICDVSHQRDRTVQDEHLTSCRQQLDLEEKRNVTLAAGERGLLENYTKTAASQRELLSTATVLYEPAAQSQAPLAAAAQLIATFAGHPLPAVSGMVPRWYIPARVRPTVYGDPRGMVLVYVDAQGRKEGPFAPEILPQ